MPISEEDLSNWLTRDQAAKMLSISTATLQRMINSGRIDYVRLGANGTGQYRITRRAVLDVINRRLTRSNDARKAQSRRAS